MTPPRIHDEAVPRTFGPLSRTDIVRFAGASGDFQPIHHDETVAQAAGYPTIFAMGMLPGSLLATYVADWLGAETIRWFRVRFDAPVWPGDCLTCGARVTSVAEGDAGTVVEVAMDARRQGGDTVVTGAARFVL